MDRWRLNWFRIAAIVLSALIAGQGCPPDPPRPPEETLCGLVGQECQVGLGATTTSIALADLDGDGDLDLAVTLYGNHRVAVALNDGLGVFTVTALIPVGQGPDRVVAADFDNDGDIDLAASGQLTRGPGVSLLLNHGDGTFAAPVSIQSNGVSEDLIAADLNGDDLPDLVSSSPLANHVAVLINLGGGAFQGPLILEVGDEPAAAAAADFNRDGTIDLAVANQGSDNVSILMQDDQGTFSPVAQIDVGDGPRAIAAIDLDGDQDADLVVANAGPLVSGLSDTITILLNDGNGDFTRSADIIVGTDPGAIAFGDLDADGDPDIVVANEGLNSTTSTIGVVFNLGGGAFSNVTTWLTGWGPRDVALGDLDGDGDLDAGTANFIDSDVTLLANDGAGGFGGGT